MVHLSSYLFVHGESFEIISKNALRLMTFLPEFEKFPNRYKTFITNSSRETIQSRYLKQSKTSLEKLPLFITTCLLLL